MRERDDSSPDGRIDRRGFVIGAGVLGGAAALDAIAQATGLIGSARVGPGGRPPGSGIAGLKGVAPLHGADFTILLRRREDFLHIQVDGFNLRRSGQSLVRHKHADAYLVFTFVPQHVVEQAFFEDGPSASLNDGRALFDNSSADQDPEHAGDTAALLAHPSRLAFQIPRNTHTIPYTLAALLDWSALVPSLSRGAEGSPGAGNYADVLPQVTQTSIELPWHLAISPDDSSEWSHPTGALSAGGSTELWHTRLGRGTAPRSLEGGPIRAVGSFDYAGSTPAGVPPAPPKDLDRNGDVGAFRHVQALTVWDRFNIVTATAGGVPGRADVQANRLWLTARGGLLDSIGKWNIPPPYPGTDLAEWRHLATFGRDQYVKIVLRGFLFPFGHRVTLTIVSEREFQLVDEDETLAAFRKFDFISVREPSLSYTKSSSPWIANDSRDFPFRSLTLTTARTPYLDPATGFGAATRGGQSASSFFPTVGGDPFAWHFVGTDWSGRQVAFTVPALFVLQDRAVDAASAAAIRSAYNGLLGAQAAKYRTAQLQGQTVAFAAYNKPGDTDLHVQSVTFACAPGAGPSQAFNDQHDLPDVAPSLAHSWPGAQAVVRLTAAEQMSGGGTLPGNSTPAFAYHDSPAHGGGYVAAGFGAANQGNVFLNNVGDAGKLVFGGGSGGGLLTPNIGIDGLSRSLGPVADVDNMFGGTFDPSSFFGALDSATFLGGLTLADIIKVAGLLDNGGSSDEPNSQVPRVNYSVQGNVVTTTVSWEPGLAVPSGPPKNPPDPDNPPPANLWITGGEDFKMALTGTITTDLAAPPPGNSKFSFQGEVDDFTFSLLMSADAASASDDDALHFIDVHFDSVTFTAASGQKTNVAPVGIAVAFAGALEFLNELEELISLTGDGGGLSISVDSSGVHADLSVSIPPIELGFITLSGIEFGAGVDIPLDGTSMAVFSFNFATAADPFTVAGGIFGGGGYFMLQIGTKHLREIQVSIDFGAMMALDIVVASGAISLTASITYTLTEDDAGNQTTVLVALVDLSGHLSILGIITLSITFDLKLVFQSPNQVTGSATLTISISIAFFSIPVSMTVSKTFSGGSSGGAGAHLAHTAGRAGALADPAPSWTAAQQMTQSDWTAYCAAFEPGP